MHSWGARGATMTAILTPRQQKLLEATCGGGLTRARVDDLVEVAGTWESLVRRGLLRCIRSDVGEPWLVITERGLLALVTALVDEREHRVGAGMDRAPTMPRSRGGDAARAVRWIEEDVVEDIEDRTPEEIHTVLDDVGAAPTEACVEVPVEVLSPQPPCSECGSVIGLKRYDGRCAPCADKHDRRRP